MKRDDDDDDADHNHDDGMKRANVRGKEFCSRKNLFGLIALVLARPLSVPSLFRTSQTSWLV